MLTPAIRPDDNPRVHFSDPPESHRAADRSQKSLHPSRLSVLRLVHDKGQLGGNDINGLYSGLSLKPSIHWDSPRKRAGELATDGYLAVVPTPDAAPRDERIFTITEQGKREIGVA